MVSEDLNNAATLRLGLMLAEMLLRGAALVAASQAGAASEAALAS